MGRIDTAARRAPLLLLVATTLWACGDDDDSTRRDDPAETARSTTAAAATTTSTVGTSVMTTGATTATTTAAAPGEGAGDATETAVATAIFERVNDERARRGLRPLEWDRQLARFARSWSEHMAEIGALEHRDINELLGSPDLQAYRALGENVYRATGPVPAGRIHVGWMESEGHRRNVLQPGFDRIGIGVVCTADGAVYATQQFGRTVESDRETLSDDTPPEQPIARPSIDGPSCRG